MFETFRQILSTESFERFSMQQTGPEYRPCHIRDFAPVHTSCQRSADNAAHAGAGHYRRFDTDFVQSLDNANVSEPADSAAAESQSNTFGFK